MSIKHALVVDDSRTAQIALKHLLEQHELAVDLADSGEAALELLEHRLVDVIFMDHTMPGMDGLQAVAAIKRNPRTATIPVMMYTTKEGEVYVGQARALGALGVLPKSVQPHVLFDMLVELGLVKDKRAAASESAMGAGSPAPQLAATGTESPRPLPQVEFGRRASDAPYTGSDKNGAHDSRGVALEALVSRILEDQDHLRAELRSSQRALAKTVAEEVLAERALHTPVPPPPAPRSHGMWPALALSFAVATAVVSVLFWQQRVRHDEVITELTNTSGRAATSAQQQAQAVSASLEAERKTAQSRWTKALDALQWALNSNGSVPYDALAFDEHRIDQLRELLTHLVAIGFRGTVKVEAHLGEFCLVGDDSGGYRLADPDQPVEACTLVGHPLDDSSRVADRQTAAFAEFVSSSPLVLESGIKLELVANDRNHSLRQHPFPSDVGRAGDWNRIAEENNRVEYSLIPESGA